MTGTITTDGTIGRIDVDNLLEWDVSLNVSESDYVEGGILQIPLMPKTLTHVVAETNRLGIIRATMDGFPGYLEFTNGDSYWRVRANEFDQASIDFMQKEPVVLAFFSTPSGVFAIVVPEPSGNWVFGFGGLLMLAKRRRQHV